MHAQKWRSQLDRNILCQCHWKIRNTHKIISNGQGNERERDRNIQMEKSAETRDAHHTKHKKQSPVVKFTKNQIRNLRIREYSAEWPLCADADELVAWIQTTAVYTLSITTLNVNLCDQSAEGSFIIIIIIIEGLSSPHRCVNYWKPQSLIKKRYGYLDLARHSVLYLLSHLSVSML